MPVTTHSLRRLVVAATGAALAMTAVVAPPAAAKHQQLGDRSLAEVLTSDGNRFDRNPRDFDILTEAVLAVLDAKPNSPVKVLTDGSTPLTAFIPNDFSFKVLAYDLTKRWYRSERRAFQAIANKVGIDAIESVLLYHVIPGATITSKQALKSDGAELATALSGATVEVDVRSKRWKIVRLRDNDPNDVDPFLIRRGLDINKGNKQIAHAILFVLRPLDL
ncbi:fasciclin domain-containing protein [Nocardioides coralli]|uniref:fasciclin domain-containing protein n=1 Tax=Nocardioides coralli TaxID=2872154 RepID=UPI001CA3D895|nr:fasciclin domain-containing protein [Nocardioides coralli]QZY29604.1 fasciclin domain-containing protein [Nocardioides coralli]